MRYAQSFWCGHVVAVHWRFSRSSWVAAFSVSKYVRPTHTFTMFKKFRTDSLRYHSYAVAMLYCVTAIEMLIKHATSLANGHWFSGSETFTLFVKRKKIWTRQHWKILLMIHNASKTASAAETRWWTSAWSPAGVFAWGAKSGGLGRKSSSGVQGQSRGKGGPRDEVFQELKHFVKSSGVWLAAILLKWRLT